MPEIEIEFASDAEYERLRTIRDKYGVTWRGMLLFGAQRLEGSVLPRLRAVSREFSYVDSGTTTEPRGRQLTPSRTGCEGGSIMEER